MVGNGSCQDFTYIEIIHFTNPNLQIPYHSRWPHTLFLPHNHSVKNSTMNAENFKRLLQLEAEQLYHRDSTPESFMNFVNPLIQELLKESRSETMTERDLEEILVSSKSREKQDSSNRNCFFDIVDLSMYRAN